MPDSHAFAVVCFSHLRWNFVFQRPQQLFSRCARERRVFFIEEPIFSDAAQPSFQTSVVDGVTVVTPMIPHRERAHVRELLERMIADVLCRFAIGRWIAWYYTPSALAFTRDIRSDLTVYDCMDELSLFAGADPELVSLEAQLLVRADVVFTGGMSLHRSKEARHHNVHFFPSSVDVACFARARETLREPEDHAALRRPRLGFYGVVDERMDLELIARAASQRPDWSFIIVGPVVKIDPASLPVRDNIYFLGAKRYEELPPYLAAWDLAIMPFAINEATRFISPTKTLEYLAAYKRVISTPIADVVEPYGRNGLVDIVADADQFIDRAEILLHSAISAQWCRDVESLLASTSWDGTWNAMWDLVMEAYEPIALTGSVA
jgi:hypothetical protein